MLTQEQIRAEVEKHFKMNPDHRNDVDFRDYVSVLVVGKSEPDFYALEDIKELVMLEFDRALWREQIKESVERYYRRCAASKKKPTRKQVIDQVYRDCEIFIDGQRFIEQVCRYLDERDGKNPQLIRIQQLDLELKECKNSYYEYVRSLTTESVKLFKELVPTELARHHEGLLSFELLISEAEAEIKSRLTVLS